MSTATEGKTPEIDSLADHNHCHCGTSHEERRKNNASTKPQKRSGVQVQFLQSAQMGEDRR